jgi:LPS O-antigen subunit length determinant protein (WzzB/FepE family)
MQHKQKKIYFEFKVPKLMPYKGLKKKPQATKRRKHFTVSLIAHTAEIVAKVLRRRIERKTDDVLREDQFGFRRGKRTRDAIEMLRIIKGYAVGQLVEALLYKPEGRGIDSRR